MAKNHINASLILFLKTSLPTSSFVLLPIPRTLRSSLSFSLNWRCKRGKNCTNYLSNSFFISFNNKTLIFFLFSATKMASTLKNVGILAMEIYFPPTCVQQVNLSFPWKFKDCPFYLFFITIFCFNIGFLIFLWFYSYFVFYLCYISSEVNLHVYVCAGKI